MNERDITEKSRHQNMIQEFVNSDRSHCIFSHTLLMFASDVKCLKLFEIDHSFTYKSLWISYDNTEKKSFISKRVAYTQTHAKHVYLCIEKKCCTLDFQD